MEQPSRGAFVTRNTQRSIHYVSEITKSPRVKLLSLVCSRRQRGKATKLSSPKTFSVLMYRSLWMNCGGADSTFPSSSLPLPQKKNASLLSPQVKTLFKKKSSVVRPMSPEKRLSFGMKVKQGFSAASKSSI